MRLIKGTLALLLLISCHIAFGQVINLGSRTFGGVEVKLPIPKGYCVIERDDPLGALHYQLQDDANQGQNVVAVLFADCVEWARRKADNSYRVRKHGSYLFPLTNGEERLFPPSYTRQKLVQELLESERIKQTISSPDKQKELTKYINDKFAKAKSLAPTLESNVNLGIIGTSDDAAFMGIGMTVKYPNESPRVTAVIGITAIRSVPVSINLYSDYSNPPFVNSLASQKKNVAALVMANK